MRLLLSIELARFGGLGPAMDQRRLQSLRNEPLAHPSDRRAADLQSIGDLGVGPGFVGSIFALVGLEQDAHMGQLARRGVAASDQALQPAAIFPGQAHGILPLPRHRDASRCLLPRSHPDELAQARYPRRSIAANQSCQDTRNCAKSLGRVYSVALVSGAKCRSRLDLRSSRTKKAPKHGKNPSTKLRLLPKSAFNRSCTGKPRSFAPETSPTDRREGTLRPISPSLYWPSPRSERCSNPFSHSF